MRVSRKMKIQDLKEKIILHKGKGPMRLYEEIRELRNTIYDPVREGLEREDDEVIEMIKEFIKTDKEALFIVSTAIEDAAHSVRKNSIWEETKLILDI